MRVSLRVRAVGLLVLWIGTQVSALGHDAFVQHATCAEHGELVDVAHGAVALEVVGAEAGDPRVRARGHGEAGHDHDHCVACETRRHAGVPDLARAVICLPAPAPQAVAVEADGRRSEIALYLLAPKTSPPV